jgi:Tfp pilus assembly protein PilN
MISVNMISARRAEHLRMLRWVRALGLATMVAGAGMLVVNIFVRAQIFETGASLNEVNQELSRLKPALDRLDQIQQARANLRPKLMVLDKAQSDTMRWYSVLVSLKRTVPTHAWLTSLNVEGGRDEAQTVRLDGVTESQSMVGETMLRLNATKLYQAVDLSYTQSGKLGDRDTVQFEVAAHLPPAETPKNDTNTAQTR